MTKRPQSIGVAVEQATRELAQLRQQTLDARIDLAQVQLDLLATQGRLLESHKAEQLLEANGNLIVAALRAQTETEQAKRELQDLAQMAELDALTGLPNRKLFGERMARAITGAKRRGEGLALLFLDLNEFKRIIDSLGHSVGDQALIETALCLKAAVREVDTVARYGGDEFLILLEHVTQRSDALLVVEKIIAALAIPRIIGKNVLRLTASVGISLYPEDGEDPQSLIDCADAAMYRTRGHSMGVSPTTAWVNGTASSEGGRPRAQLLLSHYDNALAEHERQGRQQRDANEQLVVAALNANQLQDAAEQAHRQQQNLLAMVAHELRNPLTPLMMTAGLLTRVNAQELPRMQQIIERQVLHISRLIDDLLDVSRANTGKLRIDRQLMDMAVLLNETAEAIRSDIELRQQHFTLSLPVCRLRLKGDAVRLTQVLSNLLSNASKYTPTGGAIALTASAADSVLTLTVSDNGIGISAGALPNIFEPFVQDAHAVGFNGAGLGIGLTVVRELIEAHDGSVSASSPGPGRGSVFTLTLPLCTD